MRAIQKVLQKYAEFVDYWTDGNAKEMNKDYNAIEAEAEIKELLMIQIEPIKRIDIKLYRRLRQRIQAL